MTKERVWRWVLGVGTVFALVLASLPARDIPLPTGLLMRDKLLHAAVFVGIGGVARLAFWRWSWVVGAAYAVGLGALIEVLQYFVPYRSAEWLDLLADCVGVGLALLVLRLWSGGRQSPASNTSASLKS
ncbi:MAG: VanZ family protein [Polyangiaceae bacterium]